MPSATAPLQNPRTILPSRMYGRDYGCRRIAAAPFSLPLLSSRAQEDALKSCSSPRTRCRGLRCVVRSSLARSHPSAPRRFHRLLDVARAARFLAPREPERTLASTGAVLFYLMRGCANVRGLLPLPCTPFLVESSRVELSGRLSVVRLSRSCFLPLRLSSPSPPPISRGRKSRNLITTG